MKKFKRFVKTLDFENEVEENSKEDLIYSADIKNSQIINKKDKVEVGVQTDFNDYLVTLVTFWPF